MHKQLSTEQLQALTELATLAGGTLRSITLARVCDRCLDEDKEAHPFSVTDSDGTYWHHLCNECWEELFLSDEGEAQL